MDVLLKMADRNSNDLLGTLHVGSTPTLEIQTNQRKNTMDETYELSLDDLLHELEERGIDTSKLNLIKEKD